MLFFPGIVSNMPRSAGAMMLDQPEIDRTLGDAPRAGSEILGDLGDTPQAGSKTLGDFWGVIFQGSSYASRRDDREVRR